MDIKAFVIENGVHGDKLIEGCHQVLLELYPALILRWSRIYGQRWAHIYGDLNEVSTHSLKVQLNRDYGICIYNAEVLDAGILDEIVTVLKECFSNE